jgi:uncharacterized protein (DUF58 family)
VLCVAPKRIDVQRELVESVTLGETTELTWLVANRSPRGARVTMVDALWPSLQAERRRVGAQLKPGARLRAGTTLQPTRRGRFPLGEVTVRVEGPLRMVSRQATRVVEGGLRVMPAYPSREEVQRRIRVPRVLEVGLRSIRVSGGGTEFDQLRDYRPDDEFRRIDWPATVRLQRPIVKQYRAERNQNVVLLLDNGRVMAGTVGGVPRVEHAMDAVLGVVQTATKLGDRVGMLAFDRQVRSIVVPTNGKSQLGRAAEAMYLLGARLLGERLPLGVPLRDGPLPSAVAVHRPHRSGGGRGGASAAAGAAGAHPAPPRGGGCGAGPGRAAVGAGCGASVAQRGVP